MYKMGILTRSSIEYEIGTATHAGMVRDENQDSIGRFEAQRGNSIWTLLVVCDGMGGHQGGSKASKMAVEHIGAAFLRDTPGQLPMGEILMAGIQGANAEIYAAAEASPDLLGMGTTCILLAVSGSEAYVAHVGDSRCYRIRPGVIERLTVDHSNVQRLVDAAMISEKEAHDHPEGSVLYRCVGVKSEVQPSVSGPISIKKGDRFLLCSDGLHGYVEENLIGAFALMEAPQAAAEKLLELANRRGGSDNVSVQILYRCGRHTPSHRFRPDAISVKSPVSPDRPQSSVSVHAESFVSKRKGVFALIGALVSGVLMSAAIVYGLMRMGIVSIQPLKLGDVSPVDAARQGDLHGLGPIRERVSPAPETENKQKQ